MIPSDFDNEIVKFLSNLSDSKNVIEFLGNYLIEKKIVEDILIIGLDRGKNLDNYFIYGDMFIPNKNNINVCFNRIKNDIRLANCFVKRKYASKSFDIRKLQFKEELLGYILFIRNENSGIIDELINRISFVLDYAIIKKERYKYEKIFSRLDDAVFVHDVSGKIYDFNKKAEEMLGLSREIIFQLNLIELFHNKTLIKRKIDELSYFDTTDFDYHILSSSGSRTDVNISMKYYDKEKGLILSILKNISEKIWVEEALNRNLTLVLTLLETIPNPIYYTDENNIYLGCNDAFANFIGQPKEKIIGNKIEYVASESLAKKINALNALVSGAETKTIEKEAELAYPDGDIHYFICTITKFNMQGEKFSGLIGIMVDVTKQKKAEQKLNTLYNNLRHELEIAAKVQKYLLPGWFIHRKDFSVSTCYNPSTQIGGDFYDVIRISKDKYVMYVADISGHGVQAALIMTAVKSIINIIVQNNKRNLALHKVITQLNRVLIKNIFLDNYMTLLMVLIDTKEKTLNCYNAGHPPLVELSPLEHNVRVFDEKGDIPIGWVEGYEYMQKREITIPFEDDKIYFLYTDGVYECEKDNNEILGFNNFIDIIKNEIKFDDLVSYPHKIRDFFIKSGYNLEQDDFTLVALKSENRDRFLQTFKTTYSDLRHLSDNAVKYLKLSKIQPSIINYFELILIEILNNILEHGAEHDGSFEAVLYLDVGENITIKIWDKLKEWKLPPKKVAKNNTDNNYAVNGRGFQIIYYIAKKIELKRIAEMNYLKIII